MRFARLSGLLDPHDMPMTRILRRSLSLAAILALGLIFWSADARADVTPQDPHAAMFSETDYPSAAQCGQCHPKVFEEWASSNHAYASISPMFHKFEQAISTLSSGTIGTFCVRCHQQVGTQRGEAREAAVWERSLVAREGITCITCHRINQEFTHVNGERSIVPGTINYPVTGSGSAQLLPQVIQDKATYGVNPTPEGDGTKIHAGVAKFDQISKSEFCVGCHQVAVHPGINLEVVWAQYRDSPAHAQGVTCQDCHMGKIPGVAGEYAKGPIAMANGRVIGSDQQKHSNHAFYGPGYPIAHPGLFPFNTRSLKWTIEQWLTYDYRQPWGKSDWEGKLARGEVKVDFPEAWKSRADREEARLIIEQNQRGLEAKKVLRRAVMENAGHIEGPFFSSPPAVGKGLDFRYRIVNDDPGHNMPSGSLGAQPEIWMNVVLTGPDGSRVFESGYVDSTGDMADQHSLEVREGKVPFDHQLVNLQTKFLTTNVKGTDREMYLPVNFDVDQIPFIRPSGVPTSVLNHPPLIRMEGRSIPPLGYRDANYSVSSDKMTKPGTYTLQVRLRSRAEPIYFMKFVGATQDMLQNINDWMIDIHPQASTFEVR